VPKEGLGKCSDEELHFYYSILKECVNLEKVYPQYMVKISDTKKRFIDFALIGDECKFALELDGYTYHGKGKISEEKYEDGLLRNNQLVMQNWIVLHFSYRQVRDNPVGCRLQIKKAIKDFPELKRVPYSRKTVEDNVMSINGYNSREQTPTTQSALTQEGDCIDMHLHKKKSMQSNDKVDSPTILKYIDDCVDIPSRMRIEMSNNDKVNPPQEVIFYNYFPSLHPNPFDGNYWMKPKKSMVLYSEKYSSMHVACIDSGEIVKLITSDFHTFPQEHRVDVLSPLSSVNFLWKKGEHPIRGDKLYLLAYAGENRYLAWCNGAVISVWSRGISMDNKIPLSYPTEYSWAWYRGKYPITTDLWLKLRTVDKVEGWLKYSSDEDWMKNNHDIYFTAEDINRHVELVVDKMLQCTGKVERIVNLKKMGGPSRVCYLTDDDVTVATVSSK
jgi:very-short-patch-repair endonuclease